MRSVGLLAGAALTFVLVASCSTERDFGSTTGGSSGNPGMSQAGGGGRPANGVGGTAAPGTAGTAAPGVGGATAAGAGGAPSGDVGGAQPAAAGADGSTAGEGGEGGTPTVNPVAHPNGIGCSSDTECDSGFCVEKVCCDKKCDTACSSCREANTGMKEGACGFVSSGTDPKGDCDLSSDVCGHDGNCDGAGACRFQGADQPCGQESCSQGQYTPAAHCDAAGKCAERTPISCGSYPCNGTVCAVTCSPSIQCPNGLWCDNGACKAKKPNGTTCSDNVECTNAICKDGVCCDGDCTGTCRSCRAANTGAADGHCAPITAGTDPDNECATASVSTCKNDGYCDGQSGCRQYASGTVCRAKACTDDVNSSSQSAEVACSSGACATAGTSSCGAYKCNGDTCRTSCSQNSQCVTGKYCETPNCVATKPPGSLCKAAAECNTAICNNATTNVRPGHCCTTPTNCNCPGPAFANLLTNPGFDKDLSGWDVHDNGVPGGTNGWYQFEERDACPYSGQFTRAANSTTSGYRVSIRQCVPVQAGTSYNFGGSWKASTLPEPNPGGEAWQASCDIAFYATLALCKDYDNEYANRFDGSMSVDLYTPTLAKYTWYDFNQTMTAPASAQAAVLDCSATDDYAPTSTLYFDKFYISPAPSKF